MRPLFDSWVRKIHWRRDSLPTRVFLGFPGGSAGKESTCNVGDLGLIPGLGRSPAEGNSHPFQYSGLKNPMDYSPCGCKESDTTEWLALSLFHFHSNIHKRWCKWQLALMSGSIHYAWIKPNQSLLPYWLSSHPPVDTLASLSFISYSLTCSLRQEESATSHEIINSGNSSQRMLTDPWRKTDEKIHNERIKLPLYEPND